MSPDGLLEERPTSGWQTSKRSSFEEDSRSLGELAEDVMKAAAEELASAPEAAVDTPEAEEREVTPANEGSEDEPGGSGPPAASDEPSRGGWASLIVVVILLFVAGAGVLALGPGTGKSSVDSEASGERAAAVGDGEETFENTAAPSSGDDSSAAITSVDTSSSTRAPEPTPTPAAEMEPIVEPTVPPAPEPTEPPASTATPAPNPTKVPEPTAAPPPDGVHVADLAPTINETGRKVKLTVEVYVHDSAHTPVAGAAVSGQWTDTAEPAACVTGPSGFCSLGIGPLGRPGSVTFTVVEVAYEGDPYLPALNHDTDGDSNGTSITVTF
jgi:hypothetical protein